MRLLTKGALLCLLLVLSACATPIGLSETFDRSVKTYNKMVRWHEVESAGVTYLDPKLQTDFLTEVAALKKRGLSFTDFRILSATCIPEKKTGDAVAEFDYFILPSNTIKTVTYRQNWIYQDTDINRNRGWQLQTGLPRFE